ncbi:MAG: substrate-binding domain-containing protein, partial [Candidatus Paceibacterota bacterium]
LNTHMCRKEQIPEGWEGDGAIGLMSRPSTRTFVNSLRLPTVDIGGNFTEFPQVLSDNDSAGVMAAEHFLKRNYENFSFLFLQCSRLEDEVSTGFKRTIKSAGKTCGLHCWQAHDGEHAINYRTVHRWAKTTLSSLPKPVAVMCQNDDTMAIVLNAAIDAGLHVPEDVALLGLGNSSLVCDFLPVKLSSIDVDLAGLGYRAASELDRLFKGGTPSHIPVRVPPKCVVLRESTNFLAVSDPHVKSVFREIWHHYSTPLSVGKLFESSSISKSNLHNRFKREIARPVGRELLRVRIDNAKRMLTTTDKSMQEIARACGFSSRSSFSNTFTRYLAISPRKYRTKHLLQHSLDRRREASQALLN